MSSNGDKVKQKQDNTEQNEMDSHSSRQTKQNEMKKTATENNKTATENIPTKAQDWSTTMILYALYCWIKVILKPHLSPAPMITNPDREWARMREILIFEVWCVCEREKRDKCVCHTRNVWVMTALHLLLCRSLLKELGCLQAMHDYDVIITSYTHVILLILLTVLLTLVVIMYLQ